MATQESFPSARTEYIHVRPDSSGGGLCCLHGLPAAMLQASAAATCAASKAIVMRSSIHSHSHSCVPPGFVSTAAAAAVELEIVEEHIRYYLYYYKGLPACRERQRGVKRRKRANEKI